MPNKIKPKEPFEHFIAAYRLKAGWIQKQLAKALRTTEMTVSRWETYDTRVDMPLLDAIAEVLREPLGDELLTGEDLLHHPDRPTADRMLRKLPEDDRKHFLKQIANAAKQAS